MTTQTELQEILSELSGLYDQFVDESSAYEGANFWSHKRVNELADKLVLKSQLRKEIEGLRVTYEGVKDKQVTAVEASHLGFFNRALDEVLNLLQETK